MIATDNLKAHKTMRRLIKGLAASLGAIALSACGGGGSDVVTDNQSINQMKVQSLNYGRSAVILLAGQYLRTDMRISTGICNDPVFRADSSPGLAVVTCKVTAAGPQPITITGAKGAVLFSDKITVPQPQVTLKTSLGEMVLELYPNQAPKTVNNFFNYLQAGAYKDTIFHRVVKDFVIQGGGFNSELALIPTNAPIALEVPNGLSNVRGSLAMARNANADSATSQFFINLKDNRSLDTTAGGYAVFGKVISGLDTVDAIGAVDTMAAGAFESLPTTQVVVTSITQKQ